MRNIRFILSENFQFFVVKFSIYLNMHVFVMTTFDHQTPTTTPLKMHSGHTIRKLFFGHMRTAMVQISLRIHAVWSGPSLSVNRINWHYRMHQWWASPRMIHVLCACADEFKSLHFAYVRRLFFAWRSKFINSLNILCNQSGEHH